VYPARRERNNFAQSGVYNAAIASPPQGSTLDMKTAKGSDESGCPQTTEIMNFDADQQRLFSLLVVIAADLHRANSSEDEILNRLRKIAELPDHQKHIRRNVVRVPRLWIGQIHQQPQRYASCTS
jgi:hypothetical protein